jgi:16S rRNA (uracil1498-N3)-methyltransferase
VHRFFVSPDYLKNGQVEFTREQSHQIDRVLRLRTGEDVAVLDNAGWMYDVELVDIEPGRVVGVVRRRSLASGEPRAKLTLYPALLKADKVELVLQKCTEIGVAAFVPTLTRRCNIGNTVSEEKHQRWERIIAEAAEQSERGRLPQLFPVHMFTSACEQLRGTSFIACERGDRRSLRSEMAGRASVGRAQRPFAMNLLVGPEGGFAPEEIDEAVARGIVPIGLGPRILRAETACIVGAALLLAYAGDLD